VVHDGRLMEKLTPPIKVRIAIAALAIAGAGFAMAQFGVGLSQASGNTPSVVGGVTFPPDAPGSLTQALLPTTPDDPEPAPPTGLMEVSRSYPSSVYNLQKFGWQGIVAGDLTIAMAGNYRATPGQGVLVVTKLLVDPSNMLPGGGSRIEWSGCADHCISKGDRRRPEYYWCQLQHSHCSQHSWKHLLLRRPVQTVDRAADRLGGEIR
jgi:hypothetical protein